MRLIHVRPDVPEHVGRQRSGTEAVFVRDPRDGCRDPFGHFADPGKRRIEAALSRSAAADELRERAGRAMNISSVTRGCRSRSPQGRRRGRCTSCCPAAARKSCPSIVTGVERGCRRRRARVRRCGDRPASAVHSAFDVGFESAKTIGRSLSAAMLRRTSSREGARRPRRRR